MVTGGSPRGLIAIGAAALALAGCGDSADPEPVALSAVSSRAFTGTGERPAVIWAIGDGATGGHVARALTARVARDRPARVLYLGDVYETGSPEDFRYHMRGAYGPLLRRMLPTPGNHDWPAHTRGYDRFWRGVTGAPTPPWYAVRVGGWQLLSLNSEAERGPGGPQLRWLRAQLRGPSTCRLAFWHRPRFSAGRHGDAPEVAPLWDAVTGRAALVLNGHDHDMQRFAPVAGTTAIVSGAGGRDLYAVDRARPGLRFADDRHFGGLRLALRPGAARVEAIAVDGRRLDATTVRCRR